MYKYLEGHSNDPLVPVTRLQKSHPCTHMAQQAAAITTWLNKSSQRTFDGSTRLIKNSMRMCLCWLISNAQPKKIAHTNIQRASSSDHDKGLSKM
jgi:hypothetical protein